LNGIWGTLSLGLFASGQYGVTGNVLPDNSDAAVLTGLFYGGGTKVLIAQCIGSAIVTVTTFVVALIVMKVISAMGYLRISKEGEEYGLDLHEHGISAYPEYQLTSAGRPGGLSA
jgi:ammonium transporter, Amt family